jgi:PAS domain S-box-containing protein
MGDNSVPFDIKHQASFTFMTDEDGAFVSLSPTVYYVLGYQPAELQGKSFATIAARDSVERSAALLYQMLQSRQMFRGAEIGVASKDGRALAAEISCRPVLEQGRFHGYQGVVLVISEYLPQETTPGREEHEAELLLDLVCHDINNMNQSLLGYLELALWSLNTDSTAYGYIEKCMAMVEGNAGLLRNVQKLQLISTGARTLEITDLGTVLAEAVEQSITGRGKEVEINIDRECEYKVMANALLKDAIINILSNAIKHTTRPPVIDVRVTKVAGEEMDLCLVTVDDNGPGIPDEMKRRLFNRFEHGSTPASGKGLGLYLVRKLIEGYGGRVWVEDRVPGDHSQGSRFVIALPLADG